MKSFSISCFIILLSALLHANEQPNFIFIFTDDQQADSIGAWGNEQIETPAMDRLVREGFSFRNSYCAGSFSGAVCVASRTMLMTGRHWQEVEDKKDWEGLKTLPEILGDNEYRTHIVGKWHNKEKTIKRSFQSGSSVMMGGMSDHALVPLEELRNGKLVNKREAKGFSSTIFADAAIEFLNEEQKKPFFLYVAFTAPHDTRNPPEPYREKYYGKNLKLPENFLPIHPFDNGFLEPRFRDENLAPWPRPESMIRDQIAEYYGLITHLDEQIGRILNAIEKKPNLENTYIIFTSDHGLSLGRHGLMGKQSLYEHSMKSPLIVKGPGITGGGSSNHLAYIHDLFPTILNLAKINHRTDKGMMDLSLIWNGQAQYRESLYMAFQDGIRSLRNERWKLIVYPKINHLQLFDLQNDPEEMINLASEPEHAERIYKLKNQIYEWQDKLEDETKLVSENPLPKDYDWKSFKQRRDPWQPDWIFEKYFR